MKKFCKNTGITLVALVVTVIILLFLAGISIASLTGSGLFEKAKKAREEYKNVQEKEETEIAKYGNEFDKYVENSNRALTNFTNLYGNITTTGTYTLNDSIEKFDKILFLCGNANSNYRFYQEEYYVKILKDNYGNTNLQFTTYRFASNSLSFHMTDKKTLIIDHIPSDSDLKIVAIYGIN